MKSIIQGSGFKSFLVITQAQQKENVPTHYKNIFIHWSCKHKLYNVCNNVISLLHWLQTNFPAALLNCITNIITQKWHAVTEFYQNLTISLWLHLLSLSDKGVNMDQTPQDCLFANMYRLNALVFRDV